MIRRLFWVLIGAAAGVTGYRRLSRMARMLGPAPVRGPRRRQGSSAGGLSGAASFVRDVRDGMDLYASRQADQAPGHRHTPAGHSPAPARDRRHPGTDYAKDGR